LLYFLRIFDILINLVVYLKPNLSYCPLFWGVPCLNLDTLDLLNSLIFDIHDLH
ncbi:MAG: hypothetical protein ACJA01_000160, partial [Saprospiraceae bacterium]